jgi:exonuclease III
MRAFLSRHNWPEVLFLQELKISPSSQARLSTALQATLNTPLHPDDDAQSPGRSYTVDMVLPRDRFNAKGFNGRLYGVGTILRQDFARKRVSRVRDVDWDLEGRLSIVETRAGEGDGARPLALVNVYAVNGTSAPYRNPQTGREEGTRHDHKIWFHSRLRDEVMDLEAKGFDVVIAGDMNVARGLWDGHPGLRTWPVVHCRNRADFNRKFFGREDNARAGAYLETRQEAQGDRPKRCLDGVDVFRALHGAERRYTYHGRTKPWGTSADRVDLIITSRRLWDEGRVKEAGILDSPQERGPSDHVPLWVEIGIGLRCQEPKPQTYDREESDDAVPGKL